MKTGNGAFQGSSLWLVNWPNFFGFIFVSAANAFVSWVLVLVVFCAKICEANAQKGA